MSTLRVRTLPTKEVSVLSLIRDVSVEACINDLIDNAIDAAREILLKQRPQDIDENGLPISYTGFWIKLSVGDTGVQITDNCGGMSSAKVSESVLAFGEQSQKSFAIGLYGVGLNRAVFKIGEQVKIKTTTENETTNIDFSVPEYLKSSDWDLEGTVSSPDGEPGTEISLTKPTYESRKVIGRDSAIKGMEKDISEIYSTFIKKGFEIEFNGSPIQPHFVEIRDDSPFPVMEETLPEDEEGVRIHIVAGQHIDHKFSAEPDYTPGNNDDLTSDYGWNIICNDRPVVRRNREELTGWDAIFHSQFYGFVGYVWFYSKEGEKLPWNTSKTGVDVPNRAYQKALQEMSKFALIWRKYSQLARKYDQKKNPLLPYGQQTEPVIEPNPIKPQVSEPKPDKPSTSRPKKLWAILPGDVDDSKCGDKLRDLVSEAKRINIKNSRYSALALMRMLFEVAAQDFLIEKKKMRDLKQEIIKKKNVERNKLGKKPLSRVEKNNIHPGLFQIIDFMLENPEIWGGDKDSFMKDSLNSFVNRKAKLNSAIHHPIQKIAVDVVVDTRDEITPILRNLIEREI